jgi:hypothetical protein
MPRIAQHLLLERAAFVPALVIFDKGGALLDFRAMWGEWAAGPERVWWSACCRASARRSCSLLTPTRCSILWWTWFENLVKVTA